MKLFAIFHCNLMFSSIEEEARPEVVARCYWPMLRLAQDHGFPLGIEASALTLEIIERLDPAWIAAFRRLIGQGACELVGSGYGQLIGPLLPPSVNSANLRLGNAAYERILGVRPRLALVNEQAWSAGLVRHYLDAGYEGVFMDYDNPACYAPHWPETLKRYPQRATGVKGESIPVIWSRSLVFQKLQRLAHGELDLDDYVRYLEEADDGWLAVYGNDAEIFDFRPGRFETEALSRGASEWETIAGAFSALRSRGHAFHLPGKALEDVSAPLAGQPLALASPEQPIPVKKQRKYNVSRWAVTGRDNFMLNSLCRAVAARLEETERATGEAAPDAHWRELCYCWSSDFRTHITAKRFAEATDRLRALADTVGASIGQPAVVPQGAPAPAGERFLTLKTHGAHVCLNTAKGLAIQSGAFADHDFEPLFGTLEHGFFQDIHLGADYFSGHLIMEGPGMPKTTDLMHVTPLLSETEEHVQVSCAMTLPQGRLNKAVVLHKRTQRVDVLYGLRLAGQPPGYLRMGHVTLLTGGLKPQSLFYATCNGGGLEHFSLKNRDFDHGNHVSFLVSCGQAAGMTNARVLLGGKSRKGNAERVLAVRPLFAEHSFLGLLTCRKARPAPFVRVAFSSHELDETKVHGACLPVEFVFSTGFSIMPHNTSGQ